MTRNFDVVLLGRDRVNVVIEFDGNSTSSPIRSLQLRGSGCSEFLRALAVFEADVMKLPVSKRLLNGSAEFDALVASGADHVAILLREIVLRARETFELPYKDVELCHCRAVPTAVVDRAIVAGCHTVQSVARMTSAGTSCGTCKPDTESLIEYRLKRV